MIRGIKKRSVSLRSLVQPQQESMDIEAMTSDADVLAREAVDRANEICRYSRGACAAEAAERAVRDLHGRIFAWSESWSERAENPTDWVQLSYTRFCLAATALPSLLSVVADVARGARHAVGSNKRSTYGVTVRENIDGLSALADTIERRGPNYLAKRPRIDADVVFLLEQTMGATGHLSELLDEYGEPLPDVVRFPLEGDEDSRGRFPLFELFLIIHHDAPVVEKMVGESAVVPERTELQAVSPVWWKRSVLARVPCVLWLTYDRTLARRQGQDVLGTMLFAIPNASTETIVWNRRVATVRIPYASAEQTYRIDFDSRGQEIRAIDGTFLGMTDSKWTESVAVASGLDVFTATSDLLPLGNDLRQLIGMFRSRRSAVEQIAYWRKVLDR